MDLRQKIVLFHLNWRGRRELRNIEFFADRQIVEAQVLDQDDVGVWIQPIAGDSDQGSDFAASELLKWEYIATATVHAPVDGGI